MIRIYLFSLFTIWIHPGVEATGGDDEGKANTSNCEVSSYLCKPIGLSLIRTLNTKTRQGGSRPETILIKILKLNSLSDLTFLPERSAGGSVPRSRTASSQHSPTSGTLGSAISSSTVRRR